MIRAGGLALLCALLVMPGAAVAGPVVPYCPKLQSLLTPCKPPPYPPPATKADPGGDEHTDQPVPAPGRWFGFSSQLSQHFASTFVNPATPELEADLVSRAGANAHRIAVPWKYLQHSRSHPPLPGTYDSPGGDYLQRLDERYQALLARGVTPVMHPYMAPRWASRFGSCSVLSPCMDNRGWDDLYFPDSNHLAHWTAFVAAVTRRYPAAILEGWNEPNLYYGVMDDPNTPEQEYAPWTPGPEEFKNLHCAAYRAVKQVSPARVMLSPSLVIGTGARYDFVNRVFYAGGKHCWDGFSTHFYFGGETILGDGSTLAGMVNRVRILKQYYGDTDPIWVTEAGWPTDGAGSDVPVSEADQGDAVRRLYNKLTSMPDVAGVLFHTLRDARSSTDLNEGHIEGFYGFLREDYSPKPAYCGFVARAGGAYMGC